jgi:hypothetical protein
MKMILTGLLVVFGFTTTIASADFLGETDDAYIGFQMTTPLGIKSTGLSLAQTAGWRQGRGCYHARR